MNKWIAANRYRWMWSLLAQAALVTPVHAEPVEQAVPTANGDWSGTLTVPGAKIRVVFHIGATTTMDSPDQGAFGLPATSEQNGDQVVIRSAAIGGRFEGTLRDGHLEGTWSQGGAALPLVLERGEIPGPKRPQMPHPPFPYAVEEVSIPSVPGVALAGTLTLPKGKGPFPAVVLLTGSGPHDRDETLMGHKPFWVLADHLSRNGIAVLRFDDRGIGGSSGDFSTATSEDFADDASKALAWCRQRAQLGPVGFMGHSEGGLVGPLAHRQAPADFHVLLAGPAVTGREIVLEQSYRMNLASGMPASAATANRQLSASIFDRLGGPEEGLDADLDRLLKDVPEAQRKPMLQQVRTPWFGYFVSHDPLPVLKSLDVPVLALFGEKDLQVLPDQNAPLMERALKQGTVEVLPGLNHLFQPAKTGLPTEYATIETTMAPAALDRIEAWILQTRP